MILTIHTADEYADSEDLLGEWFIANPEKRKDIFLAKMFGMTAKCDGGKGGLIDPSPDSCTRC